MPDASLLTDDVRALIGVPHPIPPVTVTVRAVHRAMEVYLGDRRDIPLVEGSPVPGFTLAALDPEVEESRPDVPRLMPNSLLISNDWHFERPLLLGEAFTRVYAITNVSERFGGRFGYSIDFRTEVQFLDPSGAIVARSGSTMTQYNAADARDRGDAS